MFSLEDGQTAEQELSETLQAPSLEPFKTWLLRNNFKKQNKPQIK